jgi:hypothetical protein
MGKLLPNQQIQSAGPMEQPPRSPDFTQRAFLFWRFVTDNVCVPPLSMSLEELKTNITEACVEADQDSHHNAWLEAEYQLSTDVGTRGNPTGLR